MGILSLHKRASQSIIMNLLKFISYWLYFSGEPWLIQPFFLVFHSECLWKQASAHVHIHRQMHTYAPHTSIFTHACLTTHGHTPRDRHQCVPCTKTYTNTNERAVWILCLKKSCDCIKNVGHIGQIIKVWSEAVGHPTALSGLPMLGCAQRGCVLYVWGRGTLLQ